VLFAEAEIAEKVRLDRGAGEELIVHALMVEAAHGSAVEADGARVAVERVVVGCAAADVR